MNEQEFWKWVKAIGWQKMVATEQGGGERIDIRKVARSAFSDLVSCYGQQQAQEIAAEIKGHYDRLVSAVYRVQNEYTEYKGFDSDYHLMFGYSSDCQMDLNSHIVGCGEKEYYRCLRSPVRMKHLGEYDKKGRLRYAEGFAYIVNALGDIEDTSEREAFLAAVAEHERGEAEWQERKLKMSPQEASDAAWKSVMEAFNN